MQDRFKFRCFDKENKCMHYSTRYSNFSIVNGVIVKIESYLTRNGVYRGKGVAYEFDDAILMQCTGLKDKNGKLIYEGDIVQFYDDDFLQTMKIVWDNDELDFKAIGLKKSVECYEEDFSYLGYVKEEDSLEVIGNIYENKELLECQK